MDGVVERAVVAVEAALSELAVVGLGVLSDGESRELVTRLDAVVARAQAAWLAAVRNLDVRPDAVAGARAGEVAATFLTAAGRRSAGRSRAEVRAARAVDPDGGQLAGLGRALAQGRVGREHVEIAVRTMARIPAHLLARADDAGVRGVEPVDAVITDLACRFAPGEVDRLTRRLLDHLDPERSDRFDPVGFQRRELSVVTDATGMVLIRGQLDPLGGAALKAVLDRFSRPSPLPSTSPRSAEVLEGGARDESGTLAVMADLRTRGQRQADALVAMARAAGGVQGSRRRRPRRCWSRWRPRSEPTGGCGSPGRGSPRRWGRWPAAGSTG